MPVKLRAAKERRPTFSVDVVALFVELEHLPRRDARFKEGERELARELGLMSAYWTMNSVLDRSPRPCHPPGYVAHADWHTCRAVRKALLASAEEAIKS